MPLLKKQDLPKVYKNYRPVSNLPFLSKIAEKCVISHLDQYLSNNDLHAGYQSAYKASFSTETALCALLDQLLWDLEDNRASIIVSLDLSAAFDTVEQKFCLVFFKINLVYQGQHSAGLPLIYKIANCQYEPAVT